MAEAIFPGRCRRVFVFLDQAKRPVEGVAVIDETARAINQERTCKRKFTFFHKLAKKPAFQAMALLELRDNARVGSLLRVHRQHIQEVLLVAKCFLTIAR